MLADALFLAAQACFLVTPLAGLSGRGARLAKWASALGFALLVGRFSVSGYVTGVWSCSVNLAFRVVDIALPCVWHGTRRDAKPGAAAC